MANLPTFPTDARADYVEVDFPGIPLKGTCGRVFPCKRLRSSSPKALVALKTFFNTSRQSERSILEAFQPASQDSLHFPSILDLRRYPNWYVTSFVHGHRALRFTKQFGEFPDFLVIHMFVQLVKALDRMRSGPDWSFKHGDLGYGNVMLEAITDNPDSLQVPGLPNVVIIDLDSLQHQDRPSRTANEGGKFRKNDAVIEAKVLFMLRNILNSRGIGPQAFTPESHMSSDEITLPGEFYTFLKTTPSESSLTLDDAYTKFEGIARMLMRDKTLDDLPDSIRTTLLEKEQEKKKILSSL